jgi:hypothetical protein
MMERSSGFGLAILDPEDLIARFGANPLPFYAYNVTASAMSVLFAATYPARTSALVMYGTYAKWIRDAEYPWAPTREDHEAAFAAYEKWWGTPIGLKVMAPSVAGDERWRQWWARHLRLAASPGAGVALYRMNIRSTSAHPPDDRVPTLVLHRTETVSWLSAVPGTSPGRFPTRGTSKAGCRSSVAG